MAISGGHDPPTYSLEGCCSIQLSYETVYSICSLYTGFRLLSRVFFERRAGIEPASSASQKTAVHLRRSPFLGKAVIINQYTNAAYNLFIPQTPSTVKGNHNRNNVFIHYYLFVRVVSACLIERESVLDIVLQYLLSGF